MCEVAVFLWLLTVYWGCYFKEQSRCRECCGFNDTGDLFGGQGFLFDPFRVVLFLALEPRVRFAHPGLLLFNPFGVLFLALLGFYLGTCSLSRRLRSGLILFFAGWGFGGCLGFIFFLL
jgi:hypothetical protein